MKKYERPVVLENNELAEGVYALGSGSVGDCMAVSYRVVGRNEGSGRKKECIEFTYKHVGYDHCNKGCYITVTFPCEVEVVKNECSSDISNITHSYGNTYVLTISNPLHAANHDSGNYEKSTVNFMGLFPESAYASLATAITCTITDEGLKNYDCPSHKASYQK